MAQILVETLNPKPQNFHQSLEGGSSRGARGGVGNWTGLAGKKWDSGFPRHPNQKSHKHRHLPLIKSTACADNRLEYSTACAGGSGEVNTLC